MIKITQHNDCKEKHQSFECRIDMENLAFVVDWYWIDTEESVNEFKDRFIKWKRDFDKAFESIDFEELNKFDWKEDRILDF